MNDNHNPARDLQRYVCDYLNVELSGTGVKILVEDSKNIVNDTETAVKNPRLAPVGMPLSMACSGKTAAG